ncbi:MAG: glycosyltransferase family 2 protein, partial [Mogibacterium sp.]|nr:glycosyltransferase family 2 protein [Mogibacterium sp.]
HVDDLKKCIDSIQRKSTYRNYEIIIAENNSREGRTFDYYDSLAENNHNIRVVTWKGEFNYSAINNYAVREAVNGEYILLLNNDTEVITPSWIEEMLMYAQRQDVGAAGAKLYYPEDTIQHAGVILGKGGIAGHVFQRTKRCEVGYMGHLAYAQDMTAVTAACMLIRRDVWEEVGGLDEELTVAFNDTDLCMKIRRAGYLIVWTPYAELYHYESLSRGKDDTPEKQARFESEVALFRRKWGAELTAGDPYYNPNLTLAKSDFSLKHARQTDAEHR